ncbi:5-(carboxyamino)imidazole ribonucleotide synthase, partial [Escherichia coli]|nr:5-(carboxyamino)imidazole ribonucleotide synthase [Escherichia coli]
AEQLAEQIDVFPPPRALEVSQDRLIEKQFLNDSGIPTAGFAPVDSDEDLARALEQFGGDGVLKTRRMGYDGKGQRVLRNASADACRGVYAAMGNVPLILEEFIPFEREISVIAARGVDGSMIAYDPAENVHREGILRSSTIPARISDEVATEAMSHAGSLLDDLDYVGVLGLEFFLAPGDRLIANEFAPRVHNSGHWTEAACLVSQFELHIRAIAGLPLPSTRRHSDAVMENLIGADMDRLPALAGEDDVLLHLYGKAETRAGRKMGHFTRISPRKA